MNAAQMKVLRDSYMVESTRPNGTKSTAGEYMRFITDCGVEFVSSKDLIIPDDTNSMLHCICVNEDGMSQANYPVKIFSAPYEDIHTVETIMSRENFKKLVNSGFLSTIPECTSAKKEFLVKWVDDVRIQGQKESKVTPFFTDDPVVIPMPKEGLYRPAPVKEPPVQTPVQTIEHNDVP